MKTKKFYQKSTGPELKHMSIEFKDFKTADDVDEDYFYFEGYLSTYGNIDRGGDIVVDGAFKKSLKRYLPSLLWQHDPTRPVGIFTSVKSDKKGLFVKGKMPKDDTFVSGEVIPQMKIGSVRAMSIGYYVIDSSYNKETDVFSLLEVDLIEGSLVTIPMNTEAEITGMKKINSSSAKEIKTKREFERALRESRHFSKGAAQILASKFSVDNQEMSRDSHDPDKLTRKKQLTEMINLSTQLLKQL